ncbi:universal stress protein [Candidatus Magnetaquicoccus inordinatus]|uniref:universal stress protein n=1 Tax=Candidatus Magnetaquicoccus inordinatus TaxID=2496818 RepID=UPI00187D2FF6|nr:universal stress protein [Candidatus Magnetaquicoccus inordinatus]
MEQPLSVGHFKNILLATDGSEFASGAEALAVSMVQRFGGQITAMQAVLFDPELEALAVDLQQYQEQIVRQSLDDLVNRLDKLSVCCATLIRHGQYPHQEIIDAAQEINADLIVMGRRGRRGLARLMLGDTTARVVAQAPRPVLVVPRAGGTLWSTSSHILLATDGSVYSERAIIEATALAKEAGCMLHVVSVVENKQHAPYVERAQAALERALSYAKAGGVAAQSVLLEGDAPAEALAEEAHRCGAALIVGGSHGRTGLGRVFLGSVMERLLGKVYCPVLIAKGA